MTSGNPIGVPVRGQPSRLHTSSWRTAARSPRRSPSDDRHTFSAHSVRSSHCRRRGGWPTSPRDPFLAAEARIDIGGLRGRCSSSQPGRPRRQDSTREISQLSVRIKTVSTSWPSIERTKE